MLEMSLIVVKKTIVGTEEKVTLKRYTSKKTTKEESCAYQRAVGHRNTESVSCVG